MPASIPRSGIPAAKRIFDLLLVVPLLILLSPILAGLALLVWAIHGRPVLFRQMRPGLHGEPFTVYKFRTMLETSDDRGDPLPDSRRITGFGSTLRTFSLDELPELFNVLRGQMSLVGPRPLLMRYMGRYSEEQARRHEVLPGITGWAQVKGRNALTWEDKFRYDTWYVDHWSLWLDIKILGLTFLKVLQREGISQEGYVSAEEFKGTGPDDQTHE
jgi:sugar transferase EpsL